MTNSKNTSVFRRLIPSALGFAAALACWPVAAVSLGELSLQSRIGQPLRATVNISSEGGKSIPAECFSVASQDGTDIPSVTGGITIKHDSKRKKLFITSHSSINEPILALVLRVGCNHSLQKAYFIMPDPPASLGDKELPELPVTKPSPSKQTAERSTPVGEQNTVTPRRSKNAGNKQSPANPIAALGIQRGDRVTLGPEPEELQLGELAVAPSGDMGVIEERLLKLETNLNSLNQQIDTLGTALSVRAEKEALANKLRAAENIEGNADTGFNNWLELLFGALAGGIAASLLARWLSRRQEARAEDY